MKEYLQRQTKIFSEKENKKIENLNVMIAGTGGLGTNQAQHLIRMGINKIYLYDNDKIEITNLNRQILYGKNDIGKYKVDAAQKHLDNYGLDTEIIAKREKLKQDTEIPGDVDLIFDALDNFESRFILEDLAVKKNIPFIHGGIESWYGQVVAIIPGETVRLKEVFSGAETKNTDVANFSPAVSIIASLQIIEGLKVYLDREDCLKNKLLLIDLKSCEVDKIDIKIE
jgi:molybdopterin/thiamine biosynthesis adenylyltransferase